MKLKSLLLGVVAVLCCACEDGLQLLDNQRGGDFSTLSISTLKVGSNTKALIEDAYLPATSEIGVTVLNSSGGAYDGADYNNIRFVATGTESSQTWAGGKKVYLSATEGYCYAYYPYQSEISDITQLPVSTSGQVDYMYADPVQVDISKKAVTLNMNHALSAIRFSLVQGTYTGTGAVTEVSVTGSGVGTSATLNAKNGELSTVNGTGSAISVSKSLTLSKVAQNVDVIVVPTNTEAALTLSVTVDGKVYTTTTSALTVQQGRCHIYTVTINAGELSLSGVKVGDWGYDENGAPTITAAGYTVTFEGDYSDIAFGNSVSGNTVTIKAINYDGNFVKEVSASSGVTVTQSVSGNTRVITLSNITSNVTVTFNGVLALPAAIADSWDGLADGVYAVRPDLKPANASEGNETCIGVGLVNAATGQKLMIEKYENKNASYKKSFTDYGATSTSYYYFYWGYYGKTMNSLLGISDYPSLTKLNSSYSDGYVPDKNGNYFSSSKNLGLPSTWPTDATQYALADRAGKQHSEYLMQATGSDGYSIYPKAWQLLTTFLASSDALGYNDWYIPACGQLALFYVYKADINAALTAIGGTTLSATSYWSSSEFSSRGGWLVNLNTGNVYGNDKNNSRRLRLVRDL